MMTSTQDRSVVGLLALCLITGITGRTAAPATASAAHTESAHTATSVWSGMRLTFHVSGSDLPKNALVRATSTVTNHSKRARRVYFGQCVNGEGSTDMHVLNEDGTEASIPQGLHPYVPCGPKSPTVTVAPGGHLTQTSFLVLTGDVVQGGVHIRTKRDAHLLTATLHLHLLDEPAPTLQLHPSQPVHALIQPPARVHGPLHFKSWTGCYDANGGVGPGMKFTFWQTTQTPRITPQEPIADCASWEWHAVAGWLNHPVVLLDYKVGTSPFTGAR